MIGIREVIKKEILCPSHISFSDKSLSIQSLKIVYGP